MKKEILLKLLEIIAIILLAYISNGHDIFPFVLTYIIYLIETSCFKYIDYKELFRKNLLYEYKCSKNKLFKKTCFYLVRYNLFFIFITIVVGYLSEKLLQINNIGLIFVVMSITIVFEPIVYMIKEYLEVSGYKKIPDKIVFVYKILDIILFLIISLVIFKIIKTNSILLLTLLYLSKILSFIIILYILFQLCYKKNKETFHKNTNDNDKIVKVLKKDQAKSIISIIKYSYIYLSIIILYCTLKYKYGFSYIAVVNKLTNIYFYDIILIVLMSLLVGYLGNKNNKFVLEFKNILNISIIITVIFSLLGGSFIYLIYNRYDNVVFLIFLGLNFIIYDYVCNYVIKYRNFKYLILSLMIGIGIKLISSYSLMLSFSRMGYDIINGEMLSSVLGLFISILFILIFIIRKEKISISKLIEMIMTVVNEGILLALILIVVSIFIPLTINSKLKSLIIILIYLIISYIILKVKKQFYKEEGN